MPASAEGWLAKKIVFEHPGPYQQQQLEAVAQVHVGQTVTNESLAAAAQRLADTAYFDDVSVSLAPVKDGFTVDFELKPRAQKGMVRVGFENFVWLTPDEITTAIHATAPLFGGYVIESTIQPDGIADALTRALATKGIKAEVTHETMESTLLHPERAMEFRVVRPPVRVANIHLSGVSTELVPLVQKSVNAVARTPYNDGLAGRLTSESILAPLLDAGYADAKLTGVTLEPTAGANGDVALVVSGTLTPGEIYHVSHLSFAGSPLMSAEAFAATQKLHEGDLASRLALLETLAPLDAAYRRRGYLDVMVHSGAALDAAAKQVAYAVTVEPGEQYRLKTFTADGLDAVAKADFDRTFQIKPGDVFNPEYVANFLKNNTAVKSLEGYSGGYKAIADPNTHTVEVVLTLNRTVINVR